MRDKNRYFAVTLILTLSACAGKASLPAITSTGSDGELVGKFVWRELLTENRDAVERFYGELFGWTFQVTELPEYKLILHQDRPIAGLVTTGEKTKEINESQWVSLLSVADVDDAVRRVRGARGAVHVEPVDIPERGRLAVVSDARGALLAFVRAQKGDPPDRDPGMNDWLWTELWTDDVEGAVDFYRDLVGYERDVAPRDEDYTVLRASGAPRAGILQLTVKKIRPHWLPYVRVASARGIAERVESLGGRVLLEPREDIREGTVAIIADPSGAVLAVQQWPREG